MEFGPTETTLEIDFDFEGTLAPLLPGLLVDPRRLSDALLGRVSTHMGHATLALVYIKEEEGKRWAGIVIYDSSKQAVARRGSLLMSQEDIAGTLAQFATIGEGIIKVSPDPKQSAGVA